MVALIPAPQPMQGVSAPVGQAVQWHPAFVPLAPDLIGGLCHSSVNCGGSIWLHQMLSCLMRLLHDSPMQLTKT